MRLKIAVKESFKKKQEMKNWQRKEMPKEARKTEIAMGDCIKWSRKCGRRMGEKSNRQKELETADRERSERQKQDNGNRNHDQFTADNSDAKKRRTTKRPQSSNRASIILNTLQHIENDDIFIALSRIGLQAKTEVENS